MLVNYSSYLNDWFFSFADISKITFDVDNGLVLYQYVLPKVSLRIIESSWRAGNISLGLSEICDWRFATFNHQISAIKYRDRHYW